MEQAVNMGILEIKGAWIYWKDENGETINSWQGKAAFRTYMKDNPEEFNKFMSMLGGEALGISNLTDEEIEVIQKEEDEIQVILPEDEINALDEKIKKNKKKKK